MDIKNIVSLFGGIAMFLFGMSVMGDSLKKVAGSKMEMILYKLSGNTLKGVLLGTGVTAVIQSSSATSVMVVGFVNSGMMKVRQAIGVILGAILGTSVTGWILCLNSLGGGGSSIAAVLNTTVLTGIVALGGMILRMFSKKTTSKNVGGIMLGFAVLMYGMSMMSGAIEPLRTNEQFITFLTSFSNPILGVLAGMVVTAVLQSASAAVGILQALAATGAIQFDVAFPIIMGIGIGASLPVVLSALGADTNGKRTAFVYLIIDILGALICGVLFYGINAFVHFGFMKAAMNMVSVAFVNSAFRFATVVFLAPAVGLLEKIVVKMFPEGAEAAAERADMDRLEDRFLTHPALSIEQSRTVINSMAGKALECVTLAIGARRSLDKGPVKRVLELEEVIDRYEDKLGVYLSKVTQAVLTRDQSKEVNMYLRALSDLERISDHARNIAEVASQMEESKTRFSDKAETELRKLEDAISEIAHITVRSFTEGNDKDALRVDPLEEIIDYLCDEVKKRHIERVGRQECTLETGFVFNDLLTNYERISDHCDNIAIDVVESVNKDEEMYAHEFNERAEYRTGKVFSEYFSEYQEKYAI